MRIRNFVRAWLGMSLAALTISATAGALPARASVVSLDIKSQPITAALNEFGQQTGIQVLFYSDVADGVKEVPALTGSFTPDEALTQLLSKTGLMYSYVNERTVAIHRAVNHVLESEASEFAGGVLMKIANVQAEGGVKLAQAKQSSADEPDGDAFEPRRDNARMDEVIVTAQKRQERLIDVPQSVTVLSADNLSRQGATQFRDFADTIPGLSFQSEGVGLTQISLRGVTVGKDVGATVGIDVDDVPFGSSTSFARGGQVTLDVGLFDLDRIEVLRGPQGTLYGASTLGGLIKYVTKQPDTTRFGGETRIGVSDTRHGGTNYNVGAMINVPIVNDKIAVRASGYQSSEGGFIDNIVSGRKDVDGAEISGGRLDVLLTPADALDIRISGFVQEISRDGFPFAEFTFDGPVSSALEQRRYVAEPFDQRFRLGSATVNYDAGLLNLTSISSYQTTESHFVGDQTRGFVPLCSLQGSTCGAVGSVDDTSTNKFTQEIRILSERRGPIEWLIGGYYTRETSKFSQELFLRDVAGQPLPNDLLTFALPSRFEELSTFGNLTWHLTERFDVTGGLRYAHNRQHFEQTGTGVLGASGPPTRASDSVVTYLANARYRLTDRQTAYVRFATGYRPGGPNFLVRDPNTGELLGPRTFTEDTVDSYEIGYKFETADGRYAFDLSGYHVVWNDIIITVPLPGGFTSRDNAPGGATVDGAELSLHARPTNTLILTGALGYQNAKLSETVAALRASEGDRLPTVPHVNASLSADYELPFASLRPAIGATLGYVDDRPASFGSPVYSLPSYTTFDVRAGLTIGAVDVQFFAHNLFDERGELTPRVRGASTTSSRTVPFLISILPPRTIGVSLSAKF